MTGGRVAQLVERLPRKNEAMNSSPSIKKKKKSNNHTISNM
jgi:hypothetical protein